MRSLLNKTHYCPAILFFVFFTLTSKVFSQYSISKSPSDAKYVNHTLDKIYNFEFKEAESLIKDFRQKHPHHPVIPFLYSMLLYWEMVPISIESPRFNEYNNYLQQTIELCEPMLKNKSTRPEACFFLVLSHSSLVYARVKAHDYAKGINEARKTYVYMKEGFDYKEANPDFYFSSGLYYYYSAQYPETHPAIKPFMWFFADGDKKAGLKDLEIAAKEAIFSKTEAIYFSAHLLMKYENTPKPAIAFTTKLVEKYPDNLFFVARHIEALLLSRQFADAEPFIRQLGKSNTDYFLMSAALFNGIEEEQYKNNNVLAKKYYERAIATATATKKQTSDYLAFAYVGLGRIFEKERNIKKAKEYFGKAETISEYMYLQEEIKKFRLRRKE